MSLTPIYDDLLREFQGIIIVSEAAEAVQTATTRTAAQPATPPASQPATGTTTPAVAQGVERTSGDVLDAV